MDVMSPEGLDTSEYVERLEREFEIILPDENAADLKTLGDLCHFISDQRTRAGRPLSEDDIWNRVRIITSVELGIAA